MPGELSVHENDVLMLFDKEGEWILVQKSIAEGGAGYVPGIYVEVMSSDVPTRAPAPSRIIVRGSVSMTLFYSAVTQYLQPPRARLGSTYINPTDRVAATKVVMEKDDIQTWHLSDIGKKGKNEKGKLGIGNNAASVNMEAVALYDFGADGVDELSVTEGEHLTVLEKDGDAWWKCRNSKGLEGVVPACYLEVCSTLCYNKIRLRPSLSYLRLWATV